MVLGWKDGENPVIKGILDKIASLESKVKLLESENKALKSEISTLSNGNPCTEWRDMLIGKKKISENQAIIINAVGSEQNNRKSRENNVVLFGVPTSKAATEEERVKEDEIITREILNEIGVPMDEQEAAKIKRFKSKSTATKSLPIRVTFGGNLDETLRTEIVVSQVLKQAKVLKDSKKFKNVFFNKDLTVPQIIQLKQLIQTRNSENEKLDAKHKEANTKANFRYGIRNDMVVKVYLDKTKNLKNN